MHTNEIRALSFDEINAVSGGEGFFEAAGKFLSTLANGPEKDPTPYINAFLKGVEQGKKKGKT
jgi:hypothetical protein